MKTENDNSIIEIPVRANANKMGPLDPDFKGYFDFKGKNLEVVLWTKQTQKGDRTYHSGRITGPFKKGEEPEVYAKGIKIYEFEGVASGSPDYQGDAAFILLGQACWAAMWIETEPEGSDSDDLAFRLELLRKPFPAKLSKAAAETQQILRERTLERRRERELREQQAAIDAESDLGLEPEEAPPF